MNSTRLASIIGLMLAVVAAPVQARALAIHSQPAERAASAPSPAKPSPTESSPAEPSRRIIRIPRTSTGPLSEDERFAIREAISKEAKNFRGGDVIVISATAAIIVLLGVIIVVLLA